MMHVEKNFKNANSKTISDKEIELLQTIITSFKDIKPVEGILLTPFVKHSKGDTEPSEFNMLLILFVDENSDNYAAVKSIVQKMQNSLNNCDNAISKIELHTVDINILKNNNSLFWKAAMESFIVSSYIIYDRNGILISLQTELTSILNPLTNNNQELVKIDNIDALNNGPIKIKKITEKDKFKD